jgi:hypothetical protein
MHNLFEQRVPQLKEQRERERERERERRETIWFLSLKEFAQAQWKAPVGGEQMKGDSGPQGASLISEGIMGKNVLWLLETRPMSSSSCHLGLPALVLCTCCAQT